MSLQPESSLSLQTAQEIQLIERRDESEGISAQNTHLLQEKLKDERFSLCSFFLYTFF